MIFVRWEGGQASSMWLVELHHRLTKVWNHHSSFFTIYFEIITLVSKVQSPKNFENYSLTISLSLPRKLILSSELTGECACLFPIKKLKIPSTTVIFIS